MRAQEPQGQELRELFTELEFTTPAQGHFAFRRPSADTDYRAAKSADDVKKLVKSLPKGRGTGGRC